MEELVALEKCAMSSTACPVHGPAMVCPSQPPPNTSKKLLVFFFLVFLSILYVMHKLTAIPTPTTPTTPPRWWQRPHTKWAGCQGHSVPFGIGVVASGTLAWVLPKREGVS